MENLEPRQNDIYTDPALTSSGTQDPVYELVKTWWRQILYLVLGIVAITYFISSFRQAHEENLEVSADHFSVVRDSFADLEAAQREYKAALKLPPPAKEEKKDAKPLKEGEAPPAPAPNAVEQAKTKLDSAREKFNQSLAEAGNQASEPYKSLREFYQIKQARLEGDIPALESKIAQINSWKDLTDVDSFERLQAELAALAAARAFADVPDKIETSRNILKELGQSGVYAAVPASIALADLASDAAQKSDALSILKQLLSRNPEQADLLRESIARLEAETAVIKK